MAITKWTKVDALTIRHDPTGVEVVKIPAHRDHGYATGLRWGVSTPDRNGSKIRWTCKTQAQAKERADRYAIPAMRNLIADAYDEAIEVAGRMAEAPAAEHFRQAVIATIPTEGLAVDLLHAEALAEDFERVRAYAYRAAVASDTPVLAPQLHPEDTPRWDPRRVLAGHHAAQDHDVAGALKRSLSRGGTTAFETLALLARLRRAELELAAARAELIRRDAEQMLSITRAAVPYPPTR